MEKFKVDFSKKAAKDYRKLPDNYKFLIDLALTKLSEGIPIDLKPIMGTENIYRLRVGKYRILLTLIRDTVLITKIGVRGDVYK